MGADHQQRRRLRRRNIRDDCDEVPTRIRKGESGTVPDKFGVYSETAAQICDGHYTSTYQRPRSSALPDELVRRLSEAKPSIIRVRQTLLRPRSKKDAYCPMAHCNVLPTSPIVEVPEFPVQRLDPCRTQGNFEVDSLAYGCRRRSHSQSPIGYRLRNLSPIGSHSPRPDKDGEAFVSSLRKYPTSPDRLATALLLQKLIKQAQDKHITKTSQPSHNAVREKTSPVSLHGDRYSKNLQTYTRSRNDSNEMRQSTKKGRSGFTSPSPQCSRVVSAEGTYEYLNSELPARGDRGGVARALRDAFGAAAPVMAFPLCPKILSRYEQHRRQHHKTEQPKPQPNKASESTGFFPWSTCAAPDASTSSSFEKLLSCCVCKKDEQLEKIRLQEIVCAWFDDLPVRATEKPQDKFIRDAMIKKLIDTLSNMNNDEFEAKGKEEIEKCINGMPMWYPQDNQERDKLKKELVDNLFDRIKGFRKRDRFKDAIGRVLDNIEFSEPVNKGEVVDIFSNALKEIALNRPTNDGIYRDKLKTKAYELLESLPIAATEDLEGLLKLKAEQLADELVRLPKSVVKPHSFFKSDEQLSRKMSQSNKLEEHAKESQFDKLEAYAKEIQDREFGAIIMKALDKVDGLRELTTEKKEKAVKELIAKLPNLLTDEEDFVAREMYDKVQDFLEKIAGDNGVKIEQKTKSKFIDNLVDDLEDTFAHHLEVGGTMSKFLVDLPKPPKPPVTQAGSADGRQLVKSSPRAKTEVHPRFDKEERLRPTDSRGRRIIPQQETGRRRVGGKNLLEGRPTTQRPMDSQKELTERRGLGGEAYLEDRYSPSPNARKSGKSQGGPSSRGSPGGKRSDSPQRQTEKRLSGQSYLEDDGSPTGIQTGGTRISPKGPTERHLNGEGYLDDEDSPTGIQAGSAKTPSSRRPTEKRRLSGQRYLEDDGSPTQTGGIRIGPKGPTERRRLSGQSYLKDDGIPTGIQAGGARTASPSRLTEKRRLSAQGYLGDEDSHAGIQAGGAKTSNSRRPTEKRRLSDQSYLKDDGIPTGIQAGGARTASPSRLTEKRRHSGQGYLDDEDSHAGIQAGGAKTSSSKRPPEKRRLSDQSYLKDDGIPTGIRAGGARTASPSRLTEKRRLSAQGYLGDEDSPTGIQTGDTRIGLKGPTDRRRLSEKSHLEDDGSPTGIRAGGARTVSPSRLTEKRRHSGQSYLEDDSSPTGIQTGGTRISPKGPTEKRRLGGQDYLRDEDSPTGIQADSAKTSSSKRPTEKRRLSDQSYLKDDGIPTAIRAGGARAASPSRLTEKRRLSGQSYLQDDGSPTGIQAGGVRISPKEPTERDRLGGQSYSGDDFSPASQRRDNTQSASPQGQTDKRRLSGQRYLEDEGSPTIGVDVRKSTSPQRQTDKLRVSDSYLDDDSSPFSRASPGDARGYVSDRDGVKRIENQALASKQAHASDEMQTKNYLDDTYEPSKGLGMSQFDDERAGGQGFSQGRGRLNFDDTVPSNIGKFKTGIQQKSDTRRPSFLFGETKAGHQSEIGKDQGKQTYSGGKSDGGQHDRGKPGNDKRRNSFNLDEDADFGDRGRSRLEMGDDKEKTVKKMKSFLGRYREMAGLKGPIEEELPETIEEPSYESIHRRSVEFSDENLSSSPLKQSMKRDARDILGGINLKNRSEVELKLADLLEDLVNGDLDEETARAQLYAILGPDVSREEADEIFNRLMGRAIEVSASMDPDGISRFTPRLGTSTPRKDRRQEKPEFDDEYGDKFDEEFHDEFDDEFDGISDREREQERARKEAEKEYNKEMFKKVKSWMADNDIMRNDAERNPIAQELANDFVDRQKYLQLNPGAKTSPTEELEHMKYQVFKRLNKKLDPDKVNAVMPKVHELMESVKKIPVPQLTKGARGANIASIEELEDAISDWIRKTPVFKKQSEKQKDAILNQMVPDLAEDLVAAIQLFATGMSNENPDDVLKGEIVKHFKKHLSSKEARASLLKGIGKDLLKHLKDLQLIPENLNTSVLGTSAMSGFNDVVTKWCNKLPIPNSEQGMKAKQDIANNIMAEIGELNMNPQILNDDVLYDDILEDFLDQQLKTVPGEIDNKAALKAELMDEVKKLKQPLQQKMAGKLYNEKLHDTMPSALPPIDKGSKAEEASFEIMKDDLADAFINLHYVGGDNNLRDKFKNKINGEIDKFAKEYLARHPDKPLSSSQLKKDLYNALKKVDVPGDESMRSEVERARMKDLIDDWAKKLPMKSQSPEEQLHTNKVLKAMAQRLLDLEKENQSNPSDDYDDKLEKEIEKYVKKLPVKDDVDLNEQNKKLAKKIKDTEQSRAFAEGSRRSIDIDELIADDRERTGRSASLSKMCRHCRSFVMQSSRSYGPVCRDAAVNPPPIDRSSQTDVALKQTRFTQCKCSKVQIPCPPPPVPQPCLSCASRVQSRVSIPCNTPRPRVSTGSQVTITPYVVIDEYLCDTPTDQETECASQLCISSQSIPRRESRGICTPEPCHTPPCRAEVTKLGSFNSNEYNKGICTPPPKRRVIRHMETQNSNPCKESCFHSPRKVWSRPHIYREPIPCSAPKNMPKCRGQMANCKGRRANCHMHHDPMQACTKCCGAKCPHPTQFFFR